MTTQLLSRARKKDEHIASSKKEKVMMLILNMKVIITTVGRETEKELNVSYGKA